MRVIVSAYSCEPHKGSEPEVGWQWVQQIARAHSTWVLTRANNRDVIERELGERRNPNLSFVYIDLPEPLPRLKRSVRSVHAYYASWQLLAAAKAQRMHAQASFDIAHHLTFVADWLTPGLALTTIPFVWGPLASHPFIPPPWADILGARARVENGTRKVARSTAKQLNPAVRMAFRRARLLIVANEEVAGAVPRWSKAPVVTCPQNGIPRSEIREGGRKRKANSLRVVSVGRLIDLKGVRLTLDAFADHARRYPSSTLTFIGEGPLRGWLQRRTRTLGLDAKVTFTGKLPRAVTLQRLDEQDVLLFPSYEGGGMVVIEALAKGLPAVVLDFGGPGEYVQPTCGIKVPLGDACGVVRGLAEALDRLATDLEHYRTLSEGALMRARTTFAWDAIGDRIPGWYERALDAPRTTG